MRIDPPEVAYNVGDLVYWQPSWKVREPVRILNVLRDVLRRPYYTVETLDPPGRMYTGVSAQYLTPLTREDMPAALAKDYT